ncbi:hypothetical protein ACS0TY_017983 [Phlomoides rotata]
MKGSQKRWQSNSTDSVIGMLMGFDEPPPQRLVPDKSRVLSESYLHKVASISLRPGSLVPIGRSCRTDNDLVDGVKGVSRVRKVLDKCVNSSSSNARSSVRSSEPEHYAGRRVLRRHQKLEHDFASNSLNFALDMKDKPLHFSSNVSGYKHSRPEYRELGKSHHEFSWKELVVKGNVSGHSCVACTRSMRRISPPERHRSKFEDVLKAECKGYGHDPHLDQSSFDRRKAVKKVDRFGVSEKPRNLDIRLCTNGSSSSISNLAAQYIPDSSYDSEEAVDAEDFTRINGDPLLQSYPGILLEEGVHSSNVEEIISREASLNELSEEESAYSKCSGIGPLENLKRISQHSPNSVLESHDTNNPPPFECFDSIGITELYTCIKVKIIPEIILYLQLQALNFELEEAHSEGSAILVSGDEDIEELFGDLSHDGRKIKRWLGDEESRNFSYLVDVLDEAGLYDTNSFMDFNKWASLECPITPSGVRCTREEIRKTGILAKVRKAASI